RDRPLSVTLLRTIIDNSAVERRFDLHTATPTRLTLDQPGVYELREDRGVGRILLRFAWIPELYVSKPAYSDDGSRVGIELTATGDSGRLVTTNLEETHRGP